MTNNLKSNFILNHIDVSVVDFYQTFKLKKYELPYLSYGIMLILPKLTGDPLETHLVSVSVVYVRSF